jgi:hypothetical protein
MPASAAPPGCHVHDAIQAISATRRGRRLAPILSSIRRAGVISGRGWSRESGGPPTSGQAPNRYWPFSVLGQFDGGRIVHWKTDGPGRIFDGCPSSDQLSWRGKIPDRAGVSIFCGPMGKRKQSRASLPSMTRPSGLMSTLGRGREIRMTSHPKRPRDPNQLVNW